MSIISNFLYQLEKHQPLSTEETSPELPVMVRLKMSPGFLPKKFPETLS